MKSPATWRRIIEGKKTHEIARLAIEDLIGYRKTSLKRAEDLDNLTNLIAAIMEPPQ